MFAALQHIRGYLGVTLGLLGVTWGYLLCFAACKNHASVVVFKLLISLHGFVSNKVCTAWEHQGLLRGYFGVTWGYFLFFVRCLNRCFLTEVVGINFETNA